MTRDNIRRMIQREERDGIVTLRLAHGKASALDIELTSALDEALGEARDARAVILTGTGSIFSAGVDLFRLTKEGSGYAQRFFPVLRDMIAKMFVFPAPLVCAVNGHAIAGGCIFACASDYKLMANSGGRIGVPELLVGVPFPAAALEVVRFAVADRGIQEIVFTGRTYLPEEARAKGLIDELCEPGALMHRAEEMATQLAAIPRRAFQLAKQQLRRESVERIERYAALADEEALTLWSEPSTHEHIRGYLEKTIKR